MLLHQTIDHRSADAPDLFFTFLNPFATLICVEFAILCITFFKLEFAIRVQRAQKTRIKFKKLRKNNLVHVPCAEMYIWNI